MAGDILLTARDVALLEPRRWLNDQLIAYYFERLASLSADQGTRALLLEPSIVYTASVLQAPALREMLSISAKKGEVPLTEQMLSHPLVLMPVNDKSDPSEHEGAHSINKRR